MDNRNTNPTHGTYVRASPPRSSLVNQRSSGSELCYDSLVLEYLEIDM